MLPALQQASQHDPATPAAQQVKYPCCFDRLVSAGGMSTALMMCTTPFVTWMLFLTRATLVVVPPVTKVNPFPRWLVVRSAPKRVLVSPFGSCAAEKFPARTW